MKKLGCNVLAKVLQAAAVSLLLTGSAAAQQTPVVRPNDYPTNPEVREHPRSKMEREQAYQ